MKKNLQLMSALVLTTLVSLPMSAAIYMNYEGIKGRSKDGKGTIEIESFSWGATPAGASGNVVQGNYIGTNATSCATGPLNFKIKGTPSPELAQLCQARARISKMVIDNNGAQHVLENASFVSCQTGSGSVPTDQFTMNFEKCATHGTTVQNGAQLQVQAAPRPNAKLIGLNPTPTPVILESLTINGNGATMTLTKAGQGTLILSSGATQKLPSMTIELTNGQKWTFYEITLENVLISSATGQRSADHPTDTFSLNFTKVEGPASGFQLRR